MCRTTDSMLAHPIIVRSRSNAPSGWNTQVRYDTLVDKNCILSLLDRTVECPPRWFDHGKVIESLSTGGSTLLCLSSACHTLPEQCTWASSTENLDTSPYLRGESVIIELQAPNWSSYVSMHSSTPLYAAFGTSSKTPLAIRSITNAELQFTPSAILHANTNQATENKFSAV